MTTGQTVQPLFAGATKDLLKAVQMGGADAQPESDVWQVTRQAMTWARTEAYRLLGTAKVTELLATAEVANPTTDAQLNRSRATRLEVLLTKWQLLQELSVLFRTKEPEALQLWNDNTLVRQASADDLQKVLDRLQEQINDLVAELDDDDDTDVGANASLIGPPATRRLPEPGGSVKRKPQNVWLRPPHRNPGRIGP